MSRHSTPLATCNAASRPRSSCWDTGWSEPTERLELPAKISSGSAWQGSARSGPLAHASDYPWLLQVPASAKGQKPGALPDLEARIDVLLGKEAVRPSDGIAIARRDELLDAANPILAAEKIEPIAVHLILAHSTLLVIARGAVKQCCTPERAPALRA